MKIVFITAYSNEYTGLNNLILKNRMDYADRWNLEYRNVRHNEPVSCWDRPRIWLEHLRTLNEGDWLWFLGCDVIITNLNINIKDLIIEGKDFICACDKNGLQSDVFLMKKCDANIKLLESLMLIPVVAPWGFCDNEQQGINCLLSRSDGRADFESKFEVFGESPPGGTAQPELLAILKKLLNQTDVRVGFRTQKEFNAYPQKHYEGTGDEPYSWQIGDFVLHLPGHTLEYRLNVFPEFLKMVTY